MLHQQTDKDSAVAIIALLRCSFEIDKFERSIQPHQLAQLIGSFLAFVLVVRVHRIIVECKAVVDANKQQRPMRPALSFLDVRIVVNGQKDVRRTGHIWKRIAYRVHIGSLHQHERHGRPEEDDLHSRMVDQYFVLQPFFPEGNDVVSEPVVSDGVHILVRQVDTGVCMLESTPDETVSGGLLQLK